MKFLRILNQSYTQFSDNDRAFLIKENVLNLQWNKSTFDDYFYSIENKLNMFIMNYHMDEDDGEVVIPISDEEYQYLNLKFS